MKVLTLVLVFLTAPGHLSAAQPGLTRTGDSEEAVEERSDFPTQETELEEGLSQRRKTQEAPRGEERQQNPQAFAAPANVEIQLKRDASEEEREGELVAGVRHEVPAGDVGVEEAEETTVQTIAQSRNPTSSPEHHVPHALPVTTVQLPVASSGPPTAALGRTLPTEREDLLKELLKPPAHHHIRISHNELEENSEEVMVEKILRTPARVTPQKASGAGEEKKKKTNIRPKVGNVTSRVPGGTPRPKLTNSTKSAGKIKTAKSQGKKTSAKHQSKTANDKNKAVKKEKGPKKDNKTKKPAKVKQAEPTHFPYFLDDYCPPECACYGRVVQCSDKGVDRVPYGIPYNARYVLLMNNLISTIQLDLLNEYVSMEFLVLSNNRLTDGSIEGAFEGIPALKRLYLDCNLLASVPTDLPHSLEELRLDDNRLAVMSEAAWARCPGLQVLSLSNNSLGNGSESLPGGVLSPLRRLRTLNLDHNRLTSVPLGLPLSVKELYLKGNLIQEFGSGAFEGTSELLLLDLSANRLSNKGLPRDALINATHLESLNLAGNRLKQVPRHLPPSLKTLNLEGNLITSVKRSALSKLPHLEHLGLARNKISKVLPGAFRALPALHQLDLSHNALRQAPRQLPRGLHSVTLTHNKIEAVPRDTFCWGGSSSGPSGLVRVQLENNLIDMGKLDALAFRCLRGFQVIHFY